MDKKIKENQKKENKNNNKEEYDKKILHYNNLGKVSVFISLIPVVIFLIGYIHTGGNVSDGDGTAAVWLLYAAAILVITPQAIILSIILAINVLKRDKKVPSYICFIIIVLEIIFTVNLLHV